MFVNNKNVLPNKSVSDIFLFLSTERPCLFMMTSFHGNTLRNTAPLVRETAGRIQLTKGTRMRSLDVVFDVNLNNLLNKQSNCCWLQTP